MNYRLIFTPLFSTQIEKRQPELLFHEILYEKRTSCWLVGFFYFGTEQWGPVNKSHCMIMFDCNGNGGNPSDDVDDDLARKPFGSSKHCADTKLRQEKRLEL